MFIEKLLNLNLRALGRTSNPKYCTCNLKTGYFQDKTKISKENKSSSELLLTSKYSAEVNVICFPSPGQSQIKSFIILAVLRRSE